jgi:hypothetical protein
LKYLNRIWIFRIDGKQTPNPESLEDPKQDKYKTKPK